MPGPIIQIKGDILPGLKKMLIDGSRFRPMIQAGPLHDRHDDQADDEEHNGELEQGESVLGVACMKE
jgi:hypothetical protein